MANAPTSTVKPTMWTISTSGYNQAPSRRAFAGGVDASHAAAACAALSAAP